MRFKNSFIIKLIPLFFFTIILLSRCAETAEEKMIHKLNLFITDYEAKIIPIQKKLNLAKYKASVSGKEDDYKTSADLNIMISKIYANKKSFTELKKIKESKLIKDELKQRQLDILYNKYLQNQIAEEKLVEIILLETEIKKKFSTFRPTLNDKNISTNEIESVLSKSDDSEKLELYWKASKKIGSLIDNDLKKLVKLRNSASEELGFNNYYEMILITNDQNPDEIDDIYDDLDLLTRGPYMQLKEEIDEYLAKKHNIDKTELMPWHYQNRFYQNAPSIFDISFDNYYKEKDIVDLADKYFSGIGIPISDILKNSDLTHKEGKSQLSYSTDIDRNGDVRILAIIESNFSSMNRLLYESGFSAYYKYIDKSLPYTLKKPAHFFTADAMGTFFSRFAAKPDWLKAMLNISEVEYKKIKLNSRKQLRLDKFVFSRWAQVMYRFEKELYEDPEQDLNELWWKLIENYQLLNKPENRNQADWAAKTHIITMPCTYHNYMLGELFASQLQFHIITNVLGGDGSCETKCIGNKKIGEYLINNVFKQGAKQSWNKMIKKSTGENLSPEYFTNQFIKVN